MSWRTSGVFLSLRDAGRALGINKRLAPLLYGRSYESNYDKRLAGGIRAGDCVWDVGANIGYYTNLFSVRVGEQGTVLGFEPSPRNFQRLAQACQSLRNVELFQCGLGQEDGQLGFEQGEDDLGATSRIRSDGSGGDIVAVRSGDSLVSSGAPTPAVIKIDVEGFEWEVLGGMEKLLKVSSVRLLGIEVHFAILKERGLGDTPKKIEELLTRLGFSIVWADSSHILATRTS